MAENPDIQALLTNAHATMVEAGERVKEAITILLNLKPPSSIRTDTALALGEAAGTIAKARALICREVDDLTQRRSN